MKFLGIQLDPRLTWRAHIESLLPVLSSAIYAIRRIRSTINAEAAKSTYYALFHSRMTYAIRTWGSSCHCNKVLMLQKKAIRAIEGAPPTESCRPLFKKHSILTLYGVYILQQVLYTKRHLQSYTLRGNIHHHDTRQRDQLSIPYNRLHTTDFVREGLQLYNQLPDKWKHLPTGKFKKAISQNLIEAPPYSKEEFVQSLPHTNQRE